MIELRARAWGELLYHELRTGRVRTLFPLGADRFFVGSGIYLPRPIEAEIRLVRDDDDAVTALTETLLDATWRWVRETDGWEEYARLRARAVAAGIPEYVLERALERILGSDPPEEPPR